MKNGNKKNNTILKAELLRRLEKENPRSAWGKGVKNYAVDLVDELEAEDVPTDSVELNNLLLSGADSWSAYSWGGSALIYNADIAAALCTPSELKKTKGGERRPNSHEQWLDVQARALAQAAALICKLAQN